MWLAALALMGCSSTYTNCGVGLSNCYSVDSGRYLVVAPEASSGPLSVLIHFHGWGSSATSHSGKSWVADDVTSRGWLGVFPDGINETWSHDGSPNADRDEIAFLDDVIADVRDRFDVENFYGSGFSQGASMAWYLACERGDQFTSFFPASGTFWDPLPQTCTAGPVNLRHTHGTSDTTFPLEGRPIGTSHQGDTLEGMALWRDINGCSEAPERTEVEGVVTCQIWDQCASGRELRLCLHDGGHTYPDDWMMQNLDWSESL